VQEVARWVALTPPSGATLPPRTAGAPPRVHPRRTIPPPMPPPLAIPLRPAPRVSTPPAMALRRSTRRPDPPSPTPPMEFPPRPVRRVFHPPDPILRRSARLALDSAGAAQSQSPKSSSDFPYLASSRIGLPPRSSPDPPQWPPVFSPKYSSSSLIGLSREIFSPSSSLVHPAPTTVLL
jgi:hypothetical protein